MTTRWCLTNDDDGHWYVIPVRRKDEFERWLYGDGGSLDGAPQPPWAWNVNGHPSNVTFSEVEIFGGRITDE